MSVKLADVLYVFTIHGKMGSEFNHTYYIFVKMQEEAFRLALT